MFKRVDHVEIVPQNFERTIDFFLNILGFKMKQRQKVNMPPFQEVAYLQLNDTMVELMSVQNPAPLSSEPWNVGYRAMALEVEDMDQAVAYLKNKGVEITWGPVSLGTSKRAEIKTPDGIPIELRQW
jgi:glyoxylase I family protein